MNWYAERRKVSQVCSGRLTPRVKEIVEENFEVSGGMLVSQINDLEFDVKETYGSSYHVNLCTKSCTCFSFQSLLIPCPHAIAAAIKEKKSIEEFVSSFYTVATLASAYADNILPISNNVNASEVKINGEGEEVAIFPPQVNVLQADRGKLGYCPQEKLE
ncbi:unnamed protein product [Brassica napus]|uniref:(rape) hypothetical protein n=1 Tax=Brassica napus TaxID=3708 RepID=A0A817B3C0_BRANA|nr:unnamed protein product [Brassica napus]